MRFRIKLNITFVFMIFFILMALTPMSIQQRFSIELFSMTISYQIFLMLGLNLCLALRACYNWCMLGQKVKGFWLILMMLAYTLIIVLGFIFPSEYTVNTHSSEWVYSYLVYMLPFLFLFFFINCNISKDDLNLIVKYLFCFVALVCTLSLIRMFVPNLFARVWRYENQLSTTRRLSGFGGWTTGSLMFLFSFLVPFYFGLFFTELTKGITNKILIMMLGMASILTLARSTIFAVMVGSVRIIANKKNFKYVVIPAIVISTFFIVAQFIDIPITRLVSKNSGDDYRAKAVQLALQQNASNPLIGIGMGKFYLRTDQSKANLTNNHIYFGNTIYLANSHNLYLDMLAETGLLGLSVFLGFLGMIYYRYFRYPFGKSRILGAFGAGFLGLVSFCFFDDQLVTRPQTAIIAYIFIGCGIVYARHLQKEGAVKA